MQHFLRTARRYEADVQGQTCQNARLPGVSPCAKSRYVCGGAAALLASRQSTYEGACLGRTKGYRNLFSPHAPCKTCQDQHAKGDRQVYFVTDEVLYRRLGRIRSTLRDCEGA